MGAILRWLMVDLVSVQVADASGVSFTWQITWQELNGEFRLTPSEPGTERTWSALGPDLFDALCDLRRQLESTGIRICVSGARTDAYPSGMSRDMGGGRMVYLLHRPGRLRRLLRLPAWRPGKLVDLFSSAPCGLVGSVDEQRNYYEKWVRGEA